MATKLLYQERRKEWVAALRSGKYTQGRGHLKKGGLYCCLGVACLVSEVGVFKFIPGSEDWYYQVKPTDVPKETLPFEVQEYYGIAKTLGANPLVNFTNKEGGSDISTLAEINDSGKYSFNTIAKIIEDNFIKNS